LVMLRIADRIYETWIDPCAAEDALTLLRTQPRILIHLVGDSGIEKTLSISNELADLGLVPITTEWSQLDFCQARNAICEKHATLLSRWESLK
jgi:hypothetical protein